MKERFGARKAESMRLRFHTQTAGSTLTAQQPENNIIRVTLQALAAALGGTQSLHTNSYDEALGLPTDHTSKIALRIQQIIMEESGATDVIDPLGGSYCLESLTREIAARAEALIAEIDAMGGMAKAIELGFPQREIEKASYECQKALESRKQVLVGVNAYTDDDDSDMKPFRVDPALERGQVERLTRIKKSRDGGAVADSLASLKAAAHGNRNLMPAILDAVRRRATIGEMCSSLAESFGKFRSAASR
jgi:methylmalonyl-CoA mutase N-terminal domain/subunit